MPQLYRGASGVLVAFGEWYWPGLGTDQTLASFNPGEGAGWQLNGRPHRHLFVRDWRGSVIKIVEQDGSGTVHAPQEYEAFGAADGAVARAGPGYNGAPSVDGFQYLRNRWYDPGTGRLTQEDPIGFAGGVNLYAYAGSNPVSYSDPYGLCPPEDKIEKDCPKDGLGDAWRILGASSAGRNAIAAYVGAGYKVNAGSCGESARGCTDHDQGTVTVKDRPGGETGVRLMHEVEHVVGKALLGTVAGGVEERRAWNRSLDYYGTLTGQAHQQAASFYQYYADWRGRDQAGFNNYMYCAQAWAQDPRSCR